MSGSVVLAFQPVGHAVYSGVGARHIQQHLQGIGILHEVFTHRDLEETGSEKGDDCEY